MKGAWSKCPIIIMVVVDGIRLVDTSSNSDDSEPNFRNIPWQQQMATNGLARLMRIQNLGITTTVPGHLALSGGKYGNYANDGTEFSEDDPSFVNLLSQETNTYGAVICSKGKLARALIPHFRQQQNIVVNCGESGSGFGNRNDDITVQYILKEIDLHYAQGRKRTTCIVNLHEPDTNAHMGKISKYHESIKNSDKLISKIYSALIKYNKNFVLLVTNDHGRHTWDVKSHGCECEGCRNIYLFAYGPSVKNGLFPRQTSHDQTNLFNTLMCATMPGNREYNEDNIIKEMF